MIAIADRTRVLEMAAAGARDREIATALGLTQEIVRGVRRRNGMIRQPRAKMTPEQDAEIAEAVKTGASVTAVARQFGIYRETVLAAMDRHEKRALSAGGGGQKKKRTCLRCGRAFLSHGAGNRLCPSCGRAGTESGLPVEYAEMTI